MDSRLFSILVLYLLVLGNAQDLAAQVNSSIAANSSSAQPSPPSIPFTPSLLDAKYEAILGNCQWHASQSYRVTIGAKRIRYISVIQDPRFGIGGQIDCPRYIDLYCSRRPKHMWIRWLKGARDTDLPGLAEPVGCDALQTEKLLYPWGTTRKVLGSQHRSDADCSTVLCRLGFT